MKSINNILFPMITVLAIILFTDLDKIVYGVLLAVFLLFTGAIIGALATIYPIARNHGTYLYVENKKLTRGSFIHPHLGLYDASGQEIKPGNILMMMDDGKLLILSKGSNTKNE